MPIFHKEDGGVDGAVMPLPLWDGHDRSRRWDGDGRGRRVEFGEYQLHCVPLGGVLGGLGTCAATRGSGGEVARLARAAVEHDLLRRQPTHWVAGGLHQIQCL
jgi:hypothetical protein